MRFLTRLSLFFLSLISFSVIAEPINKTDLAVVEKMYKEIGLSIADIDTTRRVEKIEIKLSSIVDIDIDIYIYIYIYIYDKGGKKLSLYNFLFN
jgi:hypothetical protein